MTSPGGAGVYNAGAAYLEVIPSFRGVQRAIQKEVQKFESAIGRSAGEQFGKSFEPAARDAVDKALGTTKAQAAKTGKEAAEEYMGRFASQLRVSAQKANRELSALKINDAELNKQIKTVRQNLEGLSKIKIGRDMDAGAAMITLGKLEEKLRGIQDSAGKIQLRTDIGGAADELEAFRKRVEKDAKLVIEPEIRSERQLGLFEQALKRRIEGAMKNFSVAYDADTTPAQDKLMDLYTRLALLRDKRIGVDISGSEALAEMEQLRRALASIAENKKIEIEVRGDASGAARELLEIRALAELIDGTTVEVDTKVDVDTFEARMKRLRSTLMGTRGDTEDSANAFRAFNFVVLGVAAILPALAPLLSAAAGAMVLFGAAALGAAAGLGVMMFGFSGVGDAVKALGDVQENAAKDAEDHARKVRGTSMAVRDAARAQEDAERNLADAQRDVLRAQERVNDAREQARDAMRSLRFELEGGALAERQAVIDLAEARERYQEALDDPSLTARDREELLISLEREDLNLRQIRARNEELGEEEAERRRKGIEGSDEVVAAQEGVQAAQEGVRAAQERVARAAENVAEAQLRHSEAVNETSTSVENLEEAMAKLSPAGQTFARFIHGLRDEFKQMRDIVQEGMLPGVQSAISTILTKNGELIRDFLGVMGRAIGDVFRGFGDLMTSPQWQRIWSVFTQYAPTFFSQFAAIGGNLLTFFGELFVGMAPYAERFGDALIAMTENMAEWMADFVRSDTFHSMMAWLFENGPVVWGALLTLGEAFLAIIEALEPLGMVVLGILETVASVIANMDPDVLGALLTTLLGLVVAFQVAAGALALISGTFSILMNPISAFVLLIGAVVTGFIILYTQSETFRDIVTRVWEVVGEVVSTVWENVIKPVFELIFEIFRLLWEVWKVLWETVGEPVFSAISWVITNLWEKVIKPIFEFIGDVLRAFIGSLRWVRERVTAIATAIGDKIGELRDWIGERMGEAADHFVTFAEDIAKAWFGEERGEAVIEGMKTQIGELLDVVNGDDKGHGGIPSIPDVFETAWTTVGVVWKKHGQPAMDEAKGGVKELADEAGGWFAGIAGSWNNLWENVSQFWESYVQPFFDVIMAFFNDNIKDPLLGIWDMISLGWSDMWDSIREKFFGAEGGDETMKSFTTTAEETGISSMLSFEGIGDAFSKMVAAIRETWSKYGKPFIDGVKLAFGGMRDAAKGVTEKIVGFFGSMVNGMKAPIRFIISDLINDILIDGFNRLAKSVGVDSRMPHLPLPAGFGKQVNREYATGGYTGPGTKYQAAGIVHAGEYVEPMETVDYYGTGIFEAFRKRRIPREAVQALTGYFNGGYVGMSKLINKAFPSARITSALRPGDPGYHGKGLAIDIAGSRPYPDPTGRAEMLKINRWIASTFSNITELIHTAPGAINLWHGKRHNYGYLTQLQHMNHVHWAMAGALKGNGPGLAGLLGGALDLLSSPVEWIREQMDKALGDFGDKSAWHGIMAGLPKKFLNMAADKLNDMIELFGFSDIDGVITSRNHDSSVSANVGIVRSLAASRGWTGGQWDALYDLIMKESGFRNTAQNPTSTAFGMFQFLDSTWGTVGAQKTSDPVAQTHAGLRYIAERYGNPSAALAFHLRNNWYDKGGEVTEPAASSVSEGAPTLYDSGGWLPPGMSTVLNASGRPEPILTAGQWDELLASRGSGDGAIIENLTIPMVQSDPHELVGTLNHEVRVARRGGRYTGVGSER